MKVKIRRENCLILYFYSEKERWPPCIGEQLTEKRSGVHILGGIVLSFIHGPIRRA